jgi:hypothetical protein
MNRFPQLESQRELDREARRERIILIVQDVIGGVSLFVAFFAGLFFVGVLQ